MPDKNGVSKREHLTNAWEQKGGEPLFTEPAPPDDDGGTGMIIWNWFFELNGGRQNGGFGPSPLSWGDMAAWAQLTATPLQPWHVQILRDMDNAYMSALAAQHKT